MVESLRFGSVDGMPVKALIGLSLWGMFLQLPGTGAGAVADGSAFVTMAEHLTLTGALVTAVGILWKSLLRKDELLIKMTEVVTQALAGASFSSVEMRKTLDDNLKANNELIKQFEALRATLLPGENHVIRRAAGAGMGGV